MFLFPVHIGSSEWVIIIVVGNNTEISGSKLDNQFKKNNGTYLPPIYNSIYYN